MLHGQCIKVYHPTQNTFAPNTKNECVIEENFEVKKPKYLKDDLKKVKFGLISCTKEKNIKKFDKELKTLA